ncbi:MAG: helix-turn-helix transcriptional regulator [Thermoplasmatales archaeon]|nr:helix-turn-helix transcriptional regulator [Thermoplasmatales archaeon]
MDKRIYIMHAEMCKVFTSPVRLEILDILRDGEKSVNELVQLTGFNQSNISHHLQIMKDKGILRVEKKGNYVFYSIANPKVSKAFGMMKEIVMDQLAESGKLYKTITTG